MITIKTISTSGLEGAMCALRMPMQSHDKSDSDWNSIGEYIVGKKDSELALKLAKAGPDHSKFMRMIHVQAIITAPVYFLQELQTYKVGTTCCSSSLQHKGAEHEYSFDDFSVDDCASWARTTPPEVWEKMNGPAFQSEWFVDWYKALWGSIIEALNELRQIAHDYNDYTAFRLMRQLMPMGFLYTIVWDANYQVLRTIYHQRRNHKLAEWRQFCNWIEGLTHSEWITAKKDD